MQRRVLGLLCFAGLASCDVVANNNANRIAICVSGQLRGAGARMEELMDMRRAISATNMGEARVFASIHIKDFGKGLANGTDSLRESLREHTRVAALVLALAPASYEVR